MNSLVFLRSPDVPGFCPAIGAVATTVALSSPSPVAVVRSKSPVTSPDGMSLVSSLVLTMETSPTNLVWRVMRINPLTVSFLHPTRDGIPPAVASSRASTSLYFLLSKLMIGALPPHAGFSTGLLFSMMYASLRNRSKSLHFLTGANRVRGTTMAVEPGKHSMAAPMAVSSWMTFWDVSSLGSTVFLFLIIGSGMKPPFLSMISLSLSRRIHKLLVLKNRCLVMSWKAASSSSAHMADSRRMSWLSDLRTAKCPPFLSFSVRSQHSMQNGASDLAK
mmetsp:Transcript_3163/g.8939  ORF Transcript_3163/g.8939 Transcript_3163/m.8939 type:complete len:276 (+) Transcript_3163:1860-2687(+)